MTPTFVSPYFTNIFILYKRSNEYDRKQTSTLQFPLATNHSVNKSKSILNFHSNTGMTKTRKCTIPLEHVPVLFTRHLTRKSFISLAMLNSRKLVQNYYVKITGTTSKRTTKNSSDLFKKYQYLILYTTRPSGYRCISLLGTVTA